VSKTRPAMDTLSAPYLLIATPMLLDPNFVESVVLMAHHDTEGAMGFIVNRLHEKPVRELLAAGQQQGVHAATPLHLGGPVPADSLLAVFHGAIDEVESAEIAPGLFLSRSAQVLPLLFSRAPGPGIVPGRLVFGYSGWGAGQLEREMEEGAWLALPYDQDLAFSARIDDLWRRSFERLGLNPALLTGGSGRKH
jgi:putative transcriptional regulator